MFSYRVLHTFQRCVRAGPPLRAPLCVGRAISQKKVAPAARYISKKNRACGALYLEKKSRLRRATSQKKFHLRRVISQKKSRLRRAISQKKSHLRRAAKKSRLLLHASMHAVFLGVLRGILRGATRATSVAWRAARDGTARSCPTLCAASRIVLHMVLCPTPHMMLLQPTIRRIAAIPRLNFCYHACNADAPQRCKSVTLTATLVLYRERFAKIHRDKFSWIFDFLIWVESFRRLPRRVKGPHLSFSALCLASLVKPPMRCYFPDQTIAKWFRVSACIGTDYHLVGCNLATNGLQQGFANLIFWTVI